MMYCMILGSENSKIISAADPNSEMDSEMANSSWQPVNPGNLGNPGKQPCGNPGTRASSPAA